MSRSGSKTPFPWKSRNNVRSAYYVLQLVSDHITQHTHTLMTLPSIHRKETVSHKEPFTSLITRRHALNSQLRSARSKEQSDANTHTNTQCILSMTPLRDCYYVTILADLELISRGFSSLTTYSQIKDYSDTMQIYVVLPVCAGHYRSFM